MSNFPHSTLATSLSTSPYALTNNLEALIRSRRASGTAHRTRGSRERLPLSRESSDDIVRTEDDPAVLLFPHDEHDEPTSEDERDRRGSSSSWRVSRRHPSYGATASEPLTGGHATAQPLFMTSGPAGNSRSRSKGRTPPRAIIRPMTQARRDAAAAAGASLGALGSVTSNVTDDGSFAPSTATEEEAPISAIPPAVGVGSGRGRSSERRAISPVVAFRPLYNFSSNEDEEAEAAVAAARSGFYVPGAAPTEGLSYDPAQELDAADLDIPIDEHGKEVHNAKSALGVELPLLVRSTIPVFFTQLAEYSLSLASVVSIGHLGTLDLAASSLANMTASVTCFSIIQGLATALDTLLPAAWTTCESHVGLWAMRQTVVMSGAMIPMYALWFNIEPVLLALRQDPDVAHLAGVYLSWLSIGIPGYAGNVILKKYLQAQNIMHIPTYVLFIVSPINILLNWLLVWGPDPIRLGFIGGAIATAISFNLACILLAVYAFWLGPKEAHHPFEAKAVFSRLGTVLSLGLAGTVMLSSEWWAWEICALASSLLGPLAFAAQSVLLSTCSTLYQFPAALGIAASVRVGNLLGAGRSWEAKWASRASFVLASSFAVLNSTICLLFRHKWGYMFSSDPEVVREVALVMPVIALFQLMDGMSGAANAIMRALALHSLGAAVNFTSYYIIGIPFGMWLAFGKRWELELVGIWVGLAVALTYASVIGVAIVWRADWGKGVERVRGRLGLSALPNDPKFDDEDVERTPTLGEREPLLG